MLDRKKENISRVSLAYPPPQATPFRPLGFLCNALSDHEETENKTPTERLQ